MLIAATADNSRVIHRAILLLAFVCCTLVALSFMLFARDQLAGASQHQQNQIATGATTTTTGINGTTADHKQPRRFIDGAAKELTSPFRSVVHSSSVWVMEIAPMMLALALYGLGLGFLARYFRSLR
jgi:hypothetical protein